MSENGWDPTKRAKDPMHVLKLPCDGEIVSIEPDGDDLIARTDRGEVFRVDINGNRIKAN